MRRWLSLFLLVLLPILSSWSVAAAYCVDEPAAHAAHIGHHVDAHHNDSPGDSPDDLSAGAADADCDHCHSPGATLMSLGTGEPQADKSRPPHGADIALRAPPVFTPERPKWARLA